MNKIGIRIKHLRESLKIKQTDFAKKVGISQPTLSDLENGITGLPRNIKKFAEVLGVSQAYLLFGKELKINEEKAIYENVRSVPLLSWDFISKSALNLKSIIEGLRSTQMDFETVVLPTEFLGDNCIAVKADGSSAMIDPDPNPRSIYKDDILVIDLDKEAANNNTVLAIAEGKWLLRIYNATEQVLEALNPKFPLIKFEEVEIQGVVIHKLTKY